jgi:hypothetical protein
VLRGVRELIVEINENFAQQTQNSARYLTDAGLVLANKSHSEMFEGTQFDNCFNQVWRRP